MVLLKLYSIYDSKAEQFSPPQVYLNDMLALRAFEGIVNDDKMLIKKYPEDFTLYYVGNLREIVPFLYATPAASRRLRKEVKL